MTQEATMVLGVFLALRLVQHVAERSLSAANRRYYLDPARQQHAAQVLKISAEDMQKTLAYSEDKFAFGRWSSWISVGVTLLFIGLGGLGWAESVVRAAFPDAGVIGQGLGFFLLLGLLSMLFGLPFEYYRTFVIEQKHGFNRQTVKGFFADRAKGMLIGVILGGLILALILWIMDRMGDWWWVYAWVAMSTFSILTAWIYPTFLAPMFNKFSKLEDGDLKDQIMALAAKVDFKAGGIFLMDASKRSSHGNAYFTGVFGEKRIVLFDTLVDAMSVREVVAVLAHELGHFKLHHVRWALIRGVAMTGVMFWLLSLCLPLEIFYQAFAFSGVSSYAALIVFTLWFGVFDFLLSPVSNFLSRRNEFAADRFAREQVGNASGLGDALLKLREKSHAMPLSHPLFSAFYYSHPPILERLEVMGYGR
jgi:STE24 endopeptidase